MQRMMLEPIPAKWKRLWDTCDLRSFIILSLSLQTILIFVAPLRKRAKNNWIIILLWFAYLLADWAANFAVGLILNSQNGRTSIEHGDLRAFWASFLLVHLGGPDTITAFALEDNELWLRHLFGLVFQCIAVVYVFVLSLPHNRLWIPTMLMFLTGMIKYIERTRSLYLASADVFKYSMLTEAHTYTDTSQNYKKLMDLYSSVSNAKLPAQITMISEPEKSAFKAHLGNLTEVDVVRYGYQFYEKSIGLFVDMIFSLKEWNRTRKFFLSRNARDAFRVIEVELNLIYEVLFTKLPVVYSKLGAISRIFSLTTLCLAIVTFTLSSKTNFKDIDVIITYGLLYGALILDTTALFMLLFSDWTIIYLRKMLDRALEQSLKTRIIILFLNLRTKVSKYRTRQRWCESISSYSLIYFCLHPRPKLWEMVVDNLGLRWYLDGISYVKSESFSPKLRDFIFNELKLKSDIADDLESAMGIGSSRGAWVLQAEQGWSSLLEYVEDVDYDQSLILWHIATELCYNKELHDKIHSPAYKELHDKSHPRDIVKHLSDYMMYLLFMKPSMMSTVAGIAQIRLLDTCAEVCAQFKRISKIQKSRKQFDEDPDKKCNQSIVSENDMIRIRTCMEILYSPTADVNSLLFKSCTLAKALIEIEASTNLNKWEILSKVWVEMLGYAATNSRANTQLAQVSKGGELITIVWLLMTHFGLGYKFQPEKPKVSPKLIIGK